MRWHVPPANCHLPPGRINWIMLGEVSANSSVTTFSLFQFSRGHLLANLCIWSSAQILCVDTDDATARAFQLTGCVRVCVCSLVVIIKCKENGRKTWRRADSNSIKTSSTYLHGLSMATAWVLSLVKKINFITNFYMIIIIN